MACEGCGANCAICDCTEGGYCLLYGQEWHFNNPKLRVLVRYPNGKTQKSNIPWHTDMTVHCAIVHMNQREILKTGVYPSGIHEIVVAYDAEDEEDEGKAITNIVDGFEVTTELLANKIRLEDITQMNIIVSFHVDA